LVFIPTTMIINVLLECGLCGWSHCPRRSLAMQELEQLVSACQSDRTNPHLGIRDTAIITLMYACGLRRQETVDLNLADLDLENQKYASSARAANNDLSISHRMPSPPLKPGFTSGGGSSARSSRVSVKRAKSA